MASSWAFWLSGQTHRLLVRDNAPSQNIWAKRESLVHLSRVLLIACEGWFDKQSFRWTALEDSRLNVDVI